MREPFFNPSNMLPLNTSSDLGGESTFTSQSYVRPLPSAENNLRVLSLQPTSTVSPPPFGSFVQQTECTEPFPVLALFMKSP